MASKIYRDTEIKMIRTLRTQPSTVLNLSVFVLAFAICNHTKLESYYKYNFIAIYTHFCFFLSNLNALLL